MALEDLDFGYVIIRQMYRPEHNAAAPVGVVIFDRDEERWAIRVLRTEESIPFGVVPNHAFISIVSGQIRTYAAGHRVPYLDEDVPPWEAVFWMQLAKLYTCAIRIDSPKAMARPKDGVNLDVAIEKLFQSVVEPVGKGYVH
jgi:hypothetical protein